MRGSQFVILCVDDDPDTLDVLKLVLEANAYAFVGASSAEEGLKAYRASKPDLVMVDLMMEEVDAGTSLVKELRALGCSVPVYMLSSVGDQMARNLDTAALGLAGVFQKPIASPLLLATLKARLG